MPVRLDIAVEDDGPSDYPRTLSAVITRHLAFYEQRLLPELNAHTLTKQNGDYEKSNKVRPYGQHSLDMAI